MPYKVRKVRNKDCWKVINIETGHLHSKCSTRKNALNQVRLLEVIDNDKNKNVIVQTKKPKLTRQNAFIKPKITYNLSGLTDKMKKRIISHSKNYSVNHVEEMLKHLKKGYTFKTAHKEASKNYPS
tara:strand:+ start:32 stop:409 length:378 start_codon:yes stop_codon:yes gene_type:complete